MADEAQELPQTDRQATSDLRRLLPQRARRALTPCLLLCCAFVGAAFLWRAASVSLDQIHTGFSLGPAETLNLETIKLIRTGANPYTPDTYQSPPFVITMYTPLYHYLVSLLPMPDENPFLWGRWVATLSMLLAGALLFLVAPGRRIAIPLAAFCVFFAFWPVCSRTAFLRNDSLGLLFSALAVICAGRAGLRPNWGIAAAFLSVLAVMTKQPLVSAAVASALYLLFQHRGALRVFLLSGIVASGVVLIAVYGLWGHGFWFATLQAPRQPVDPQRVLEVSSYVVRQPLFIVVVGISAWIAARSVRANRSVLFTGSPYFLYLLVSMLVMFATLGKKGSGDNYFFEPLLALLMWVSWELSRIRPIVWSGAPVLAALLLAGVAMADLAISSPSDYAITERQPLAAGGTRAARIRSTIESLGLEDPSVVGVVEHPGLHRESDRVQLSSPLQYRWLWSDGVLDLAPFLESIERGAFDVILVPRFLLVRGAVIGMPLGPIVESVQRSYVVGTRDHEIAYYVPRTDPPR